MLPLLRDYRQRSSAKHIAPASCSRRWRGAHGAALAPGVRSRRSGACGGKRGAARERRIARRLRGVWGRWPFALAAARARSLRAGFLFAPLTRRCARSRRSLANGSRRW